MPLARVGADAMTDPMLPAKLDVFLSYKREERDVAEALAKFLITRGYDVWWDAALLAGEDFAKIVHAELNQARAVVVLWSKQARGSHWVRTEAKLALGNGTLINAVIDDMAFEGIPPEYSNIQAVRLKDDPAAFHEEIAAAIARKGTQPSLGATSAAEALTQLADKVKDADFFRIIADSIHIGDYEEYLEKFSEHGQFAGLARRRIAALQKTELKKRSLWSRLAENGAVLATFLGGAASLVAVLAYLGLNPAPRPAPDPDPNTATATDNTTDPSPSPLDTGDIVANPAPIGTELGTASDSEPAPMEELAKPLEQSDGILTKAVDLAVTNPGSGLSDYFTGTVLWTDGGFPSLLPRYSGVVTFASGDQATVAFSGAMLNRNDILLTLAFSTADGPLEGLTAITGLSADGVTIAISTQDNPLGIDNAALSSFGKFDGSFQKLVDATQIVLALSFANGDTGTLKLPKSPGGELQDVLFGTLP